MNSSGNLNANQTEQDHSEQTSDPPNGAAANQNRVIKRMGGRHLIFTTKSGGSWLPKPYALVSSFGGPVWLFYGFGQVWLTHRKASRIGGWRTRVPRFRSEGIVQIIEQIKPHLEHFIEYCNSVGIEGTIVLENSMLEFHWTFGYELKQQKQKPEFAAQLDRRFQQLVDHFTEVTRSTSQ